MKPSSVSFIGSGNLAWHLAPALDNTNFAVREVYSKTPKHAEALVERLYEARVAPTLDFSSSASQVFIIAVSDDALADVVRHIKLPEGAMLVHTSGSQPLHVLDNASTTHIGVLYPLQTFSKGRKVDFAEIPLFVESEQADTEKVLMHMAKAISGKVYKIASETRMALHIGAVFASNFTNHMLTIAKEIVQDKKLKFDYLKPLIMETISKGLAVNPEQTQTGPARRGDLEILDKHMEFLKTDEQLAEIYKVISQHIVDKYHS